VDDIKAIKKQAREYKKALLELSDAVVVALNVLDIEMRQPSSPRRGEKIGLIANTLNYQNDMVRHFTLGLPLKRK
jgi:hypothetical protein